MGLFDKYEWHTTSWGVPLLRVVGAPEEEDDYDGSGEGDWLADLFNISLLDLLISFAIFMVSNYLLFFIITFGVHQGLFYWMIWEYKELGKTYLEPWEYYRNWPLIKEE